MIMGEERRALYQRQIKNLYKRLAQVEADLVVAPTQELRGQLEDRLEQIIKAIENYEQKVDTFGSENNLRMISNHWEHQLHRIDYGSAKEMINKSLKPISEKSGSALFLIQQSREYCSHYCIQHLRNYLEEYGTLNRPYIIEFSHWDSPCPELFLNKLGEELKVEISSVTAIDTEAVIDAFAQVLRQCNILFLQVSLVLVETDDAFLNWFINNFWCALINRLPTLSRHNPCINLIGIVSIGGTLSQGAIQCGCEDKIFRLPQEKWQEADILRWLRKFSGVAKSDESFQKLSKSIFAVSQGTPYLAERQLLESLEKLARSD
jgi:inactive STAND